MNYLITKCLFKPPSLSYSAETLKNTREATLVKVASSMEPERTIYMLRVEMTDMPRCAILYCHGNMEDAVLLLNFLKYISQRYEAVVFAAEYTGYGPTRWTHTPSMEYAYDDVACALHHIREAEPTLPLVVWSRSMGCAPALRAIANAGANACEGLILESPFLSPLMTVIPFRTYMESNFENIDEIERLRNIPILFIHGQMDTVVGSWHSETLFRMYSKGPKELVLLPNGKHNDLFNKLENRTPIEKHMDIFMNLYIFKH